MPLYNMYYPCSCGTRKIITVDGNTAVTADTWALQRKDMSTMKSLGAIGWIINKIFGHRKTLHNPFFWIVLFGIEYYFLGAWVLGGVFPVASHLVTDKL